MAGAIPAILLIEFHQIGSSTFSGLIIRYYFFVFTVLTFDHFE